MSYSIYIRPLVLEDAMVSYQWRNNPKLWRFTGSKPDRYITPEIETEWLAGVLKRENEKRFAICLSSTGKYIGNIFFTDITKEEAYVHIFIGEMEYWGKNRAYDAGILLFDYGFNTLGLERIFAEINKNNRASLTLAKYFGFREVDSYYRESINMTLVKLEFTREMFEEEVHIKNKVVKE